MILLTSNLTSFLSSSKNVISENSRAWHHAPASPKPRFCHQPWSPQKLWRLRSAAQPCLGNPKLKMGSQMMKKLPTWIGWFSWYSCRSKYTSTVRPMDGDLGYVWILPKVTTSNDAFLDWGCLDPLNLHLGEGLYPTYPKIQPWHWYIDLPTFTKPWKSYHSCIPIHEWYGYADSKDSIVAVIFSDSGCLSPPSIQEVMHHRKLPTKQWAVSPASFPFPRREDLEIGWSYPVLPINQANRSQTVKVCCAIFVARLWEMLKC